MTPALNLLKQRKIAHTIHTYTHDASAEAFGLEAAEKLNVPPARVFKTLVAQLDTPRGTLHAFAIIPSDARLNLKALADALNAKRAELADPADAQRLTGYVVGGISPIGGKKRLPAALDISALTHPTIYVSAGRRGLQMELAPADLVALTAAVTASLQA